MNQLGLVQYDGGEVGWGKRLATDLEAGAATATRAAAAELTIADISNELGREGRKK